MRVTKLFHEKTSARTVAEAVALGGVGSQKESFLPTLMEEWKAGLTPTDVMLGVVDKAIRKGCSTIHFTCEGQS